MEEPPFWLVWNEFGFAPKYRHNSRELAEREAERLAALSPGNEYFVLQPTVGVVHKLLRVRRFSSPDGGPPF